MLPRSLSFSRSVPQTPHCTDTPQHNSEDAHSDTSSQQSTQEKLPVITDDTPPTDDPPLISRHPDTLRAQEITHLPKLSIPLFSANVLEWQSF